MNCDLVQIEWLDSRRADGAWQWLSDFKPQKPVDCVSVGWLIHDGKDYKCVAQNFGDLGYNKNIQVSGIIEIPTCSITKISKLTEEEEGG